MRIYNRTANDSEDIARQIANTIEEDSGKTIFTFKVLEDKPKELDVIIVFDDGSVLRGTIYIQVIDGEMACRIKGNYI